MDQTPVGSAHTAVQWLRVEGSGGWTDPEQSQEEAQYTYVPEGRVSWTVCHILFGTFSVLDVPYIGVTRCSGVPPKLSSSTTLALLGPQGGITSLEHVPQVSQN